MTSQGAGLFCWQDMTPWWYSSCFSPTGSPSSPSVSLWERQTGWQEEVEQKDSDKEKDRERKKTWTMKDAAVDCPNCGVYEQKTHSKKIQIQMWVLVGCSANWYTLHHGLGSFLQTGGETSRNVGRSRVNKKTLSVYSTQLGLHILAPWDETKTKTRT